MLDGERVGDLGPSEIGDAGLPTLTGYGPVVDLATQLETVATQTYVSNVMTLEDTDAKELMASR